MTRKRNILGTPSIDRIGEESVSLKRLVELEEALNIPPERGGVHFSEGERQLVRTIRRRHSATRELTAEQRDKIKKLWESLRKAREERL